MLDRTTSPKVGCISFCALHTKDTLPSRLNDIVEPEKTIAMSLVLFPVSSKLFLYIISQFNLVVNNKTYKRCCFLQLFSLYIGCVCIVRFLSLPDYL